MPAAAHVISCLQKEREELPEERRGRDSDSPSGRTMLNFRHDRGRAS